MEADAASTAQATEALVCIECGDESPAGARGWRVYVFEAELLVYCPGCAWREFDAVGPALVLLLPGMVAYGVWQLLAGHLLRIGRRGFLAATAWLFGLTSIVLQALGAQVFGLAGAAAGLSIAYVLATIVVLIAFARLSGRPLRDLVPVPGDLAFYVGLTRRVLAPR